MPARRRRFAGTSLESRYRISTPSSTVRLQSRIPRGIARRIASAHAFYIRSLGVRTSRTAFVVMLLHNALTNFEQRVKVDPHLQLKHSPQCTPDSPDYCCASKGDESNG